MRRTLIPFLFLALAANGGDDPTANPSSSDVWWSFRPLEAPPIPAVRNPSWMRTPVDAFILAGLEAKGLQPSAPADRTTLIRRLTFDLHGLPPTPEAIDAFLADTRPDVYERLVDRLLASPHYGERWGRHWLDVVHYGDTHGYDKDKRRDRAWLYRDYVIRAFNDDLPFTEFIRQQLAGDVLYPERTDGVIATGFIAAGPWDFVGHVELREGTVDKLKTQLNDRDDMVSSTFSTFQSLTVGCARCHDHKFDPIPQAEYYGLQAVFAGVERGDRPLPDKSGSVFAVVPRAPRTIHRLVRGNVEQPRGVSTPAALTCIPGFASDFAAFTDVENEGARRVALATWIANPRNPLTWRSIVNRVWHYHFGRGIVDTPNDFGANGSMPTHPELLDWLAANFRDGRQSLKDLHRLILTSSVYQQTSRANPAAQQVDSDNRRLWRMNRTRLDAESVRDSILAIAGRLQFTMGGPGFEPFQFKDDHSPVYDYEIPAQSDHPTTRRRTVYRFIVRSVPHPFLDCLDCADPNSNTPVRNTTLTALQALALLNDAFVIRQAEHFAARLQQASDKPVEQLNHAYRLTLGRLPDANERQRWKRYIEKHGLANACRLLSNTNEFVFVD